MPPRKKAEEEPTVKEVVTDVAANPEPPSDPPLDAVIVIKETDPDGNLRTNIVTNGSVQPTEVQTLLELGLKGWRERLGLV